MRPAPTSAAPANNFFEVSRPRPKKVRTSEPAVTTIQVLAKQAMSDKMLDLVARRFRTLGEPYRLRILQELEAGEKSVGELVAALAGNQPNVSKHLQVLFDGGLIGRRREGTSIFYAISDPAVFRVCALVCGSEAERSRRDFEALSGH